MPSVQKPPPQNGVGSSQSFAPTHPSPGSPVVPVDPLLPVPVSSVLPVSSVPVGGDVEVPSVVAVLVPCVVAVLVPSVVIVIDVPIVIVVVIVSVSVSVPLSVPLLASESPHAVATKTKANPSDVKAERRFMTTILSVARVYLPANSRTCLHRNSPLA